MDNMSKQYRNNNVNSSKVIESKGKIDAGEETLLLGLIKNKVQTPRDNKERGQILKLNLEELAGLGVESTRTTQKANTKISLDDLAQKLK